MQVINTPLQGCFLVNSKRHEDERGFFQELFRIADFQNSGVSEPLVQHNWSRSYKGVLRGMHFQRQYPQGKLLTVIRGTIFDVVVDIRKSSATFGKWHAELLSEDKSTQLWIPPGFAHGFMVLSDMADVLYKTTAYYNSADEGSFMWNDECVGINWPAVPDFLSDKDSMAPKFTDALEC